MAPISLSLLLLLVWSHQVKAAAPGEWEDKVNEEGQKVQSMQMEAPTMTEEDQYGYNMPDRYRCDSCKAIVYHLEQALTQRQPKNRRLHEWEYQELFDETCKTGFKGYGIKLIDGKNTLSGAALIGNEEKLKPGFGAIQMGGENWEKRLGEICRKFTDAIGEDELYENFRAGSLSQELCITQSRDCRQGPEEPVPRKKTNAQEASKKKSERKPKTQQQGRQGSKHSEARAVPERDILDVKTFLIKLAVSITLK